MCSSFLRKYFLSCWFDISPLQSKRITKIRFKEKIEKRKFKYLKTSLLNLLSSSLICCLFARSMGVLPF